jgi:hypothetical protein
VMASPQQLRPNRLDELLLRGRDPYRPAVLLRVIRLQVAFIVSVLILAAFVGFLFWSAQQTAQRNCAQRNQRTEVSTQILGQAADAAHADGDANLEMVFRQLAKATREAPLPKC